MGKKKSLRAPEGYNRIQRGSWYAGIVIGIVLISLVAGAIIGIIIAGIRWIAIS